VASGTLTVAPLALSLACLSLKPGLSSTSMMYGFNPLAATWANPPHHRSHTLPDFTSGYCLLTVWVHTRTSQTRTGRMFSSSGSNRIATNQMLGAWQGEQTFQLPCESNDCILTDDPSVECGALAFSRSGYHGRVGCPVCPGAHGSDVIDTPIVDTWSG